MSSDTVKQLNSIQPEHFASDFECFEAKEAARGLLARLETPFERAWTLTAEQPVVIAGLILVKDLGIWARWAALEKKDGPGTPRSLADVLSMCSAKVEPNLIRRVLRHLAAVFVLEEVDVDTWKPTPFSLGMGDDVGKMVQTCVDHTYPGGLNLPKFLAKIGYMEPVDLSKFDNYTDTFGDPYWARCEKNPAMAESFTAIMTGLTADKMDWTAVYDTNRIVSGADLSSSSAPPLFVDVAGLHIVDVQTQADKQAAAEGRPRLDSRIARMPHDFYKPQPLLGARAYFLHTVLHDWPDENCVRILEGIKGAMKKGYSKLLLYEVVMLPKEATTMACTIDMSLMAMNSGMERTETHWREMLEGVGLKVVRIDRHKRAVESVIEAELA